MNKYVTSLTSFLFEQAAPPMPAPAPMPGAPAANKPKPSIFIFIDDSERDELKRKKYPDGSVSVDFPAYSVMDNEIKDWVSKNVISSDKNKLSDPELEVRRKNIIDIIKGDKVNIGKQDVPFIEKLKNAVSTDIFGKREPDVNVIFTKHGQPTTEEVNVTFIKYTK